MLNSCRKKATEMLLLRGTQVSTRTHRTAVGVEQCTSMSTWLGYM